MDARETVTLVPATRDDEPLLANLLQLYIHDLSDVLAIEIGADGRFGYPRLALYWSEPEGRFPFLMRSAGRIAGFALAARGSPASDDPSALDVAEFFVLRRHRRSAVGRRAAALLWRRLPGHWIVRVSEGNRAGLPFWESVVREFTGGSFVESRRPGQPHDWRVFSFQSAP